MSVNDVVVQGAEPLFFLDYFATASSIGRGAAGIAGIAEGCPQPTARADRRRDGGNARHV